MVKFMSMGTVQRHCLFLRRCLSLCHAGTAYNSMLSPKAGSQTDSSARTMARTIDRTMLKDTSSTRPESSFMATVNAVSNAIDPTSSCATTMVLDQPQETCQR